MNGPCLEIHGLTKRFGSLPAISGFSLSLQPGERHLILGPNGAGKTTLFNLIGGDLRADAGSIRFFGTEVGHLDTARRAALGMGRTYQIITLFQRDSLAHNVTLALLGRRPWRWSPWGDLAQARELHDEALQVLQRVGLEALAGRPVAACSYGEKRRLEIALALAQRPRLLLLDEPLAGLSAAEREQVLALLGTIPRDTSIIMVEHDMDAALSIAERISVMHYGRLIVAGTRAEVVADPKTREVYLGH